MPLGAFKTVLMGMAGVSSATAELIRSLTASASGELAFTTDLTSDYDVYIFQLVNLHPSGTNIKVQWHNGIGSGPTYGETTSVCMTRSYGNYLLNDSGLDRNLEAGDTTGWLYLNNSEGSVDRQGTSSMLTLYNPASSVFYKSFQGRSLSNTHEGDSDPYYYNMYCGGRIKTTVPITAVKFRFETGNIDTGVINLYGMKVL